MVTKAEAHAAKLAAREKDGFEVQATQMGFFDDHLKRPGDRFKVTPKEFSESWMIRLSALPEELQAAPGEPELTPDEKLVKAEELREKAMEKAKAEVKAQQEAKAEEVRILKEAAEGKKGKAGEL